MGQSQSYNNGVDRPIHIIEASLQGRRPTQEDAHYSKITLEKYPFLSVLCIFDGHNGEACAKFCEDNIGRYLDKYITKNGHMTRRNADQMFYNLDREFCELDIDSGSTAVIALFNKVSGELTSLNVGDSRCILSRHKRALRLSVDHKPIDEEEKLRILRAGHNVWQNRLDGALMVSRAIGDKFLKYATLPPGKKFQSLPPESLALTPQPTYRRILLGNMDEFILLACDGLFEVFTDQQAIEWIHDRLQSQYRRRIRRQKKENSLSPSMKEHDKKTDHVNEILDNSQSNSNNNNNNNSNESPKKKELNINSDDDSDDESDEEDDIEDVDMDPELMLDLALEAERQGNSIATELAGAAIAQGSNDNVSIGILFLANVPDLPLQHEPPKSCFDFFFSTNRR